MTIKYSNWPAQETSEQAWEADATKSEKADRKRRLEAVHAALDKIPEVELRVVREHHFEGKTFAHIAEEMGVDTQTVANQFERALRRLRKLLADFAKAEYGISPIRDKCVICDSPGRESIDKLLAERKPGEELGSYMRKIRTQFGVKVVSPMTIVAHLKYHK